MYVSIILACRNEGGWLKRTVDGLLDGTYNNPIELVVVDDGCTDESVAFFSNDKERYRNVKLLHTQGIGLGPARNLGAAHAKGDVFVFCDGHIFGEPHWLDLLLAELVRENTDAVCPTILTLKSDGLEAHAWDVRQTAMSGRMEPELCGKTLVSITCAGWTEPQDKPFETPLLPGGCFAVKQAVFEAVGGYQNAFCNYGWDEEELSIKLWTFGYVLKAVPTARIRHYFRYAAPYTIRPEDVLYTAMCHYNDERVQRLLDTLEKTPERNAIYNEVFSMENLQNKRDAYQRIRVHNDDWFFNRFNLPF